MHGFGATDSRRAIAWKCHGPRHIYIGQEMSSCATCAWVTRSGSELEKVIEKLRKKPRTYRTGFNQEGSKVKWMAVSH